jgi:hypothetical protein
MIDPKIFQEIESTHALAEFVILQDKMRSFQELCAFSTKFRNKACSSPLNQNCNFPSFDLCHNIFETTGSLIILDKKIDRLLLKSDTSSVLEVYSAKDHVAHKDMKAFRKCAFLVTTLDLVKHFSKVGAPRAMTKFENFHWKRIIVMTPLSASDLSFLQSCFPGCFIWMLVSQPSIGFPTIYDTPYSKSDVLVSCFKVKHVDCSPVLLHWQDDITNLDNKFFMQTVREHNRKTSRCIVCLSKSKVDCITSCGHVFCKCCCVRSVQITGGKCPVCKQEVHETKNIFSLRKKRETEEESISRIYGQLAFQNYFLAISAGGPTLHFVETKADAETLGVLLKRKQSRSITDVLVAPSVKPIQALRFNAYGKYKTIVYNSNTKMLDDYLGIVASNLGAEEIFNIHF